jgi:acyl-CoA synthetase (AMP-forming)/AMP-acid ligase II
MNIAEVLRERARERGDALAIVEAHRRMTFAELDRLAAAVAGQLKSAGLEAGHHAFVLCPMSVALYAILIGLWRLGGVAMIVDPAAGRDHIDQCCRRSPPHAFISVPRGHLLRLVSSVVRAIPIQMSIGRVLPRTRTLHVNERAHRDTEADGSILDVSSDTAALVTFTSGSTGQPKAAVRTHAFLLAQHRVLADDLHLRAGQRDLATLPVFVLANLASGVTSVIPDADLRRPGAIPPAAVLRQMQETAVTRVAASPAFLDRLARPALGLAGYQSPLEEIYTGGAPVFPAVLRRLHAMTPRAALVAVYGSTEAEPIARIEWREMSAGDFARMESGGGLLAGQPVPAIDLRIVTDRWGEPLGPLSGEAFDAMTRGANDIGEIVVAGSHVLTGYLGGIGDSETKIHVGHRVWHRTGDAGYRDECGRLWLLGRCSARIGAGPNAIYPFAVECAALTINGVERCALVEHEGQRILVVELSRGAPATVSEQLTSRLAWATLGAIREVPAIPMDRRHNAKVDYPALEKLLETNRLTR